MQMLEACDLMKGIYVHQPIFKRNLTSHLPVVIKAFIVIKFWEVSGWYSLDSTLYSLCSIEMTHQTGWIDLHIPAPFFTNDSPCEE